VSPLPTIILSGIILEQSPLTWRHIDMKNGIIILTIVAVGLAVGLVLQSKKVTVVNARLLETQTEFVRVSNNLQETSATLAEHDKLYALQETKLKQREEDVASLSQNLVAANTSLTKAQDQINSAVTEMQKQGARIAELETMRDNLSKRMDGLTNNIAGLEQQITDTRRKLASAEGDRAFLLKELDRLQKERSELVRQFNDLAFLRGQVSKLQEEYAVNQRLDWMNKGVYASQDRKGAEALVSKANVPPAKADRRLNVEIYQDGPVKAGSSTTNSPAR
jgi:chromosome segregation ATPase